MKNLKNIEFISAGAGSGKTYKLTEDLHNLLSSGKIDPSKVIATTFTVKAAAELRERVRQKLLEKGENTLACQMGESLIGTVNSVCGQLLERFSFEAGLSPELSVIDEQESQHLFNMALESNLSLDVIRKMNSLAYRLGQEDWRANVQAIVKMARSNNIDHKKLTKMGRESSQSLLKFFPKKVSRDLKKQLLKIIEDAINNIVSNYKGDKEYVSYLTDVKNKLKSNNLQWSEWVKLIKEKPTSGFMDYKDAIAQVAMDYEKHPQLHADIKEFTELLFTIASESIHTFQSYKAKRGLIDFVDQEQLLLSTLEELDVQERLSEELDLLMVDEFQDTSPIQLALFLKMAKCAGKVIFVGDIKQSIYGFRGSDPSLMFAVIDAIKNGGGSINILQDSWRSCKSLVHYTNAVFKNTFENSLKAEQIELNPQRKNLKNENVLEHWQFNGSNIAKRNHALASAIKKHIASKRKIFDKDEDTIRDISFGDISILSRSNDNVDAIASVLSEHQIPVQKVQTNLIGTAEVSLVIACIRCLIDKQDTLAVAEILSLSESLEPEVWLQDRLDFLDTLKVKGSKSANISSWVDDSSWAEDSPIISQLNQIRKTIKLYSPVEIVEHIIIDLHLRSIINQWGSDQQSCLQRLNNLDALIALSQDYESYCQTSGDLATLSGLLLWWYQQQDEGTDEQAMISDQDAVHIMTYHKAKGLEWPVVILMDLNKEPRTRIWQTKMLATDGVLDINNPLIDRSIQFWPWPFGKQAKGIHVKDIIDDSDLGQQAYKDAVEEEKRLLYVAMTRARDELILTTDNNRKIKPQGWLVLTSTDWLLPELATLQLPADSTQKAMKIKTASHEFEEIEVKVKKVNFKPQWFNHYPEYTEKLIESISPSSAEMQTKASAGELISIGDRMPIMGSPDMAELGNAIHVVIAAKCINDNFSQADTDQLLDSLAMNHHIKTSDVLNVSDSLISYINSTYPNAKLHAEYPIQHVLDNGQIVKGWIDLLIETEQGWIICDHKSSPKKVSQLQNVALEYSGQLKMYADAMNEISELPVLSTIIYFPVSGNIAPVFLNC